MNPVLELEQSSLSFAATPLKIPFSSGNLGFLEVSKLAILAELRLHIAGTRESSLLYHLRLGRRPCRVRTFLRDGADKVLRCHPRLGSGAIDDGALVPLIEPVEQDLSRSLASPWRWQVQPCSIFVSA